MFYNVHVLFFSWVSLEEGFYFVVDYIIFVGSFNTDLTLMYISVYCGVDT